MEEQTRADIISHALKEMGPPMRECCGVIIIEKGKEKYIPCKNISERNNAFAIDPKDYLMAHGRGEIIAFVHSHCYQNSQPSQIDLVSCEATKLPWYIISVPNLEWTLVKPTGYKAPLIGRSYSYGVLDCYTLIVDWYKENFNIQLNEHLDREDNWWNKGQNIFMEKFADEGFYPVPENEIKHGDVLLMQLGAPVPNHVGVFLEPNLLLHHHHHRLSSRDVYGGWYRKHTRHVLRHKEVKK